MNSLKLGKVSPAFLEKVVMKNLGRASAKLLVGPKRGFDNAIVSLGGKNVLLLTTDPVSVIPRLGMCISAWLSVHLIASDYTTSGLKPEFATFSFNFPPEITSGEKEDYLKCIGNECKELGVAIAAGNTGTYPGATFTVVGAGTMFGLGLRGDYVDPSMAREGDVVIMTKGAAIEAAAALANSFPEYASDRAGAQLAGKARALVKSCSTVRDALTAASLGLGPGGVTSMHDATEGGVLGGLDEMASASGHAILVRSEKILVSKEAAAVCSAFEIDPLTSLSEGTLLVTCARGRADELTRRLGKAGIYAGAIGTVGKGSGVWVSRQGGHPRRARPRPDQYWRAYVKAANAGLT